MATVYAGRMQTRPVAAEHRFFMWYAFATLSTLILGFLPSYVLPMLGVRTPSPWPLSPLVHIHGVVFFAWALLYFVQSLLPGAGNLRLHRRLGQLALPLMAAMVVLGVMVAFHMVTKPGAGPADIVFLPWVLGDTVTFAALAGAALRFRRKPPYHKRLMALAMAAIMGAGLGRLLGRLDAPDLVALILPLLLFAAAVIVFDLRSRGRVHQATAWGSGVIVGSAALRMAIMMWPGWPPVGRALVRAFA
jgi:hypothetical protein